jgi:predicted dehydrogenase
MIIMKNRLTRRAFLAQAAATAGLGAAAPYVLTSNALGAEGAPASDRVRLGHIGVGGMGSGHLGQIVRRPDAVAVAVCDIDQDRRYNAQRMAGEKAAAHHDFRELLDRQDIDAVVVASPDHWHPLHTVHACEAGKDVYVEKPLSVTVVEGRAMVQAARRYGRVVQMGTQWRSMAGRNVAQFIRNGHCGRVREVRCWHYPNPFHPPANPVPVPATLDYDFWLGPLAYIPYHPARTHGNFRWLLCSGGGNIRDRGAHIYGIVSWAMNVDATGPVSIVATGEARPGLYDNPITMSVTYEFKNPDWTLRWDQPGEPKGGEYGAFFVGDKDTLAFWDNFATEQKALVEPAAHEVALERSDNHMSNFLACVRTRRRPIMDAAIGHHVTTLCNLGNIAYRLGRKLQWDAEQEQFLGDEQANRLLHYPYRAPWRL